MCLMQIRLFDTITSGFRATNGLIFQHANDRQQDRPGI